MSPVEGKLYKVPLEGGEATALDLRAVGVSAVSPDGDLIGYFFPGKMAGELRWPLSKMVRLSSDSITTFWR